MPELRTDGSRPEMLSIVVPSFHDNRIFRTIRSIRRLDDCGSVQIVVIDGGSNKKLLEGIQQQLETRDILISEPDQGIFDALNKGTDAAEGRYLGWLGSDDIFSEQVKASQLIEVLKTHEVCVGNTVLLNQRRVVRVFKSWPVARGLVKYGLHNPHFSTFGHTELFRKRKFDVTHPAADIDYFIQLFNETKTVKVSDREFVYMQAGGFSNGSIRRSIRINKSLIPIYGQYHPRLVALGIVVAKLVIKLAMQTYYRVARQNVNDPLLGN